jgi:drug/metabolite transporter (DMT)-like permease
MLASAPNALLLKTVLGTTHPLFINALRFGLAGLILLPYILTSIYGLRKAGKWLLQGTAALVVATVAYVYSLEFAPASYVSLFALLSPIIMVLFAQRLLKERIATRAYAGITLAAGGAGLMCLLPFISTTKEMQFYPVATALCIVSVMAFPFSIIRFKQVHQKFRVALPAIVGFSSMAVAGVSLVSWLITTDGSVPSIGLTDGLIIGYAGGMVLGVWRILMLRSYDFVSTPVLGILTYLEAFVAILLAVMLLHEKLTWYMWAGGVLIVLGVFVVEYHKYSRKHSSPLVIPHKILQLMK